MNTLVEPTIRVLVAFTLHEVRGRSPGLNAKPWRRFGDTGESPDPSPGRGFRSTARLTSLRFASSLASRAPRRAKPKPRRSCPG